MRNTGEYRRLAEVKNKGMNSSKEKNIEYNSNPLHVNVRFTRTFIFLMHLLSFLRNLNLNL